MADKEPQAAAPALAGEAAEQQDTKTVQATSTDNPSAAQPSSDPIPPPAATSSSEKPTSSDKPATSQQPSSSPPAAAAQSDEKGKQPAATTPPAPPTKEQPDGDGEGDGDSLSIEPSQPITPSDHPVCNITLLLPTGARHPYKIDERYLTKRGVDVPDVTETGKRDPFSISVYTLKELILREWREEWNDKPASPSSIRLIHFGKLLDDKEQLKKYQFSRESPNVVHMSVRPAEMMEEAEDAKGKSSGREGRTREGGSSCCVIL